MKKLPNRRLNGWRRRLAADNVKLVYWHVARRLKGFNEEAREDAAAHCMQGLVRAAQLFDPKRKAKRTGEPVKFGTYAMHWIKSYFQRWTDGRVREEARNVVQMSAMGERREHRGQWEPAEPSRQAEDEVSDDEAVTRLLRVLPRRERLVLKLRFVEGLTLEQVGERLGVTRERVRQIEKRAKARARRLCAVPA